ncbi:MAG: hypothetical protein K2J90_06550 [Lachnospiraceae bacterium]|nr:hypothetical protein [Lachnospiraceae bacterium]
MAALIINTIICIIIPIILLGVLFFKNPMERKGIFVLFLSGGLVYLLMEFVIKEQGLQYLFNHTDFTKFMADHYIAYLFVVALAGAVFAVLPEILIIVCLFKRQMSLVKAVAMGIGYAMAEAVMLAGAKSIFTIIEMIKGTEAELTATTIELYLSGYERFLLMLIQITMIVVLVYFVEHKMTVRGVMIKVLCQTITGFLPGFLMAFTYKDFYEVYDRQWALALIYIFLTAAAFCSAVVLNSLKYALKDDRVDSPAAVARYQKKREERQKHRERKKQERTEKKEKRKKTVKEETKQNM